MARRATGMKTSAPRGRTGRLPATASKTPAKTTPSKKATTAKRPSATPVGFTSKDDLRAQVDKLERANTALRAKSREATRAAKLADSRIVELEEKLTGLEKRFASQTAAAKRSRRPASVPASEPTSLSIDPGDAVPPGVAPGEPIPLDKEAERARENLDEQLGHEQAPAASEA